MMPEIVTTPAQPGAGRAKTMPLWHFIRAARLGQERLRGGWHPDARVVRLVFTILQTAPLFCYSPRDCVSWKGTEEIAGKRLLILRYFLAAVSSVPSFATALQVDDFPSLP